MPNKRNVFVPFGNWSPDTLEFDAPELEVASNVTPHYGSYRPVEGYMAINSVTDSEAMNNGVVQLVSEEAPPIRMVALTHDAVNFNDWWTDHQDDYVECSKTTDYNIDYINSRTPDDTKWLRGNGLSGNFMAWKMEAPRITPSVSSDGDLKIRVRCRRRQWEGLTGYNASIRLYQGAVLKGSDTINIPDGNDDWYEHVWSVTNAIASTISDWTDLRVWVNDVAASGTAKHVTEIPSGDEDLGGYFGTAHSGAGKPEADGDYTVDVYRFMEYDHANPNDWKDSFVQSPNVKVGDSPVGIFKLNRVQHPHIPDEGETWMGFRVWAVAQKANTDLTMQIVQPLASGEEDASGDTITAEGTEYRVAGEVTWSNLTVYDGLDDTQLGLPKYYDLPVPANVREFNMDASFYAIFKTEYSGGSSETFYAVPDAEPNGEWQSPSGSVSVDTDELRSCSDGNQSNADGTAGISWSIAGGSREAYPNLGTSNPTASARTGHAIYLRVRGSKAGESFTVDLHKNVSDAGGTRIYRKTITLSTSWTWHKLNVGETTAQKIDDYSDLGLRLACGPVDFTVDVDEIYFEYPGDSSYSRIWAMHGGYNGTPDDYLWVSWIAADVINPAEDHTRDRTEIFAGNKSKLYRINSDEWEDVTRTSAGPDGAGVAYGNATNLDAAHKIWDFTTFGDKIIATNFCDEIQQKDVADTDFSPLIDQVTPGESPYAPRARFAATVASSLVLADINPSAYSVGADSANYTDGKPYHLWASKPMDPGYFDVADLANQTALFALVGQPGAITGLVGGEYGVVFKRNSIWRMQYVGLPQIFQIDNIAIGQGCAHPQSIVQVGQDIFFWGNGGIFVLVAGGQLQSISEQRIEKAIFDTQYENIALAQDYGNDSIENEGRVYGAYDSYTGIVWWVYRGKEDPAYQLSRYVAFSTKEGRWSSGQFDDGTVGRHYNYLQCSFPMGRPNVNTGENHLNRGLYLVDYKSTTSGMGALTSQTTMPAELCTKVLSSTTHGSPPGFDTEVQSVRVIFKADPDTYIPNFKIEIVAGQDPTLSSQSTRTVYQTDANRDGWIPLGTPLSGEYFKYTLTVPRMFNSQIKEILGLQVETRRAGEF